MATKRRSRVEGSDDMPSTSTGSSTMRSRSLSRECRSAYDKEAVGRILGQIRAVRDKREANYHKKYILEHPNATDDEIKAYVNEQLSSVNNLVLKLESHTVEYQLEDLLKRNYIRPRTSGSSQNSVRSPPRTTKTLEPIQVKVEDGVSSNGNEIAESHSLLAVNPSGESNVEKAAKQEAQIMTRIAELRRSGLWSTSRLPLCVEPSRNKTHWDYLLEEMKWMANDFRQERITKRKFAKTIATAISRQRREQEQEVEKKELRVIRDGKRICANVAKMVKDFWQNVDRVVDYRATSILESLKRKELDNQLKIIVGVADDFSSIVQEGLLEDKNKSSKTPSIISDMDDRNDRDFAGFESESDDEKTIAKEEKAMMGENVEEEVDALEKEAIQDMDDLLASLPPEYLASLGYTMPSTSKNATSSRTATSTGSVSEEDSDEDEDDSEEEEEEDVDDKDIAEASAEKTEKKSDEAVEEKKKPDVMRTEDGDEAMEVDDIEEAGPSSSTQRLRLEESVEEEIKTEEQSTGDEAMEEEKDSTDEKVIKEEEVVEDSSKRKKKISEQEGNGDGRGMLDKVDYAKLNSVNSDDRQEELANIAEEALKFQPKGFTLETTQVKTEVPFLVRGKLREYQMVGLDWLVTLYEKNLNGILADEMGLGKTIQTIALLAHLACSESIWGPHLIVVPTSVILNWEMELKKWCPAFKILTYFGGQKERAEKRKGWSKPNSFHVCITSYKTITTDIRSFKMKAWQYLILDEAQNIKNWKSQRWQALLNIRARRRLLLTGTPLQNSLMELWSLMHFLMPAIFSSHDDFKDWFSNPLTGMMEGSVEFNAPLVQRLHKVLRPFILRRLKSEVEKQMPEKKEHVIKCSLSKRQRYLYDDFMSQRSTKDNLKSGNMMSVLNIVMQLRKCCNHPNLFEPRPVVSPFALPPLRVTRPAMIFDLVGDGTRLEEEKQIPECLDLRARFTGWQTSVKSRRPLVEELMNTEDAIEVPKVKGFKFQRPIPDRSDSSSAMSSPGLSQTDFVDVAAAELERVGLKEGDLLLVLGEGDDLETLMNSQGASVPMRARLENGSLVVDTESPQQSGRARLCQVVAGVNGENQLKNLSQGYRENSTGQEIVETSGNAPVPITCAAEPAPEMAAFPMATSSTTGTLSNGMIPKGQPYSTGITKRELVAHPSLRATTVLNPQPLTVQTTETSGFHHQMQNGGARESLFNPNYQFSPPLKRKKTQPPPVVTGDYKECVPDVVRERLEQARQERVEKAVERFGRLQQPLLPAEMLSLLWNETRKVDRKDDEEWCHSIFEEISITDEMVWQMENWQQIMVKKFVLAVDAAQTDSPILRTTSSGRQSFARLAEERVLATARLMLHQSHPLTDAKLLHSRLQFPELRLIEYDCGKLQVLAQMLRDLYMFKHRCLIFTQMSRMLDVLQAFLSFHGYQYFRLDGTTGIEQRQAMMERFNADPTIFCFILSTRSGGVGVNLTGADTVIFYDSDWNPTMDAQAQDRCHRIGQTRNVNIYRLISERTIEENILKKAMQKKRLGEMAIDEGGFTPDFFKQTDSIRDLFDGEAAIEDVAPIGEAPKDQRDLEKAMASLEDEQDVEAAKMATAEARADKAEFDDGRSMRPVNGERVSQLGDAEHPPDEKYLELITNLKPIERYAVNFMEAEYKPEFEEELKEAKALIEQKKTDFARKQEKAMNEAEDEPNSDFYSGGSLLEEVRTKRRGRKSLSVHTAPIIAARHARALAAGPTSRHSVRTLLAKQHMRRSSPIKTSSGRRIISPSTSSSASRASSLTQAAARSAVRKAVGININKAKIATQSTSASYSPSSDTPKRGRGRPRKYPIKEEIKQEIILPASPPSAPPQRPFTSPQQPNPAAVLRSPSAVVTNRPSITPMQSPRDVIRLPVKTSPVIVVQSGSSIPSSHHLQRPVQRPCIAPTVAPRTVRWPTSTPLPTIRRPTQPLQRPLQSPTTSSQQQHHQQQAAQPGRVQQLQTRRVVLAPPREPGQPGNRIQMTPQQRVTPTARPTMFPVRIVEGSRSLTSQTGYPRMQPIIRAAAGQETTGYRLPVRSLQVGSPQRNREFRTADGRTVSQVQTSSSGGEQIRRPTHVLVSPSPIRRIVSSGQPQQQVYRRIVLSGASSSTGTPIRTPGMPVRIIQQDRPGGLGEYERPRVNFRQRSTLDEPSSTGSTSSSQERERH